MNLTTPLSFQDLLILIVTLLYFLIIAFAFYLPLRKVLASAQEAKKWSIPISLSAQMLFGYIFYSLKIVHLYPFIYFPLILIVNIIALWSFSQGRKEERQPKKNWSTKLAFLGAVIILPLVVSRFYDSLRFVYSGNPDTAAHITMLRQLLSTGKLKIAFYAPGFHLLLLPLGFFFDPFAISRFSGPVIGLLTALFCCFLFQGVVKKRITFIFFFLLFAFPLLNRLILQTIGFFPSALTFIYFPALLYLASYPSYLSPKKNFLIFLTLSLALAISVPYLFVQVIPILLLVWLSVLILKKFSPEYRRYLGILLTLAFIGLGSSFFHVYLQTKIVRKGKGFPKIALMQIQEGELLLSSNYNIFSSERARAYLEKIQIPLKETLIKWVESDFYKSMLGPLLGTGYDILKVKNILRPTSALTIAGYFCIALSLGLFILGLSQRNLFLLVFSGAWLVMGIATQTGVLEMSSYRGRSGWYFMFTAFLLTVYLFDYLLDQWPQILKHPLPVYLLFTTLWITPLVYPLTFPRFYYPEIDAVIRNIAQKYPTQQIALITDIPKLKTIAPNLTVFPLEPGFLTYEGYDKKLAIIKKQAYPFWKTLNQIIFSPNKERALRSDRPLKRFLHEIGDPIEKSQALKLAPGFQKYQLYWENPHYQVYLQELSRH